MASPLPIAAPTSSAARVAISSSGTVTVNRLAWRTKEASTTAGLVADLPNQK